MLRFDLYQQTAGLLGLGQWRWRLWAGTRVIAHSGESYQNKSDCEHAINLVKQTDDDTPVR